MLHAIKQVEASIQSAVDQQLLAAKRKKLDSGGPERWGLAEYIQVSLQAGVIDQVTAQAAELCGDFRNLIHSGRAAF